MQIIKFYLHVSGAKYSYAVLIRPKLAYHLFLAVSTIGGHKSYKSVRTVLNCIVPYLWVIAQIPKDFDRHLEPITVLSRFQNSDQFDLLGIR